MSVNLSCESVVSASFLYFTFLPLSALLLTPRPRFMGVSMYVSSVPSYFQFGSRLYQTQILKKFATGRALKIPALVGP